jgi:hypothetical protein
MKRGFSVRAAESAAGKKQPGIIVPGCLIQAIFQRFSSSG